MKRNTVVVLVLIVLVIWMLWCYSSRSFRTPDAPVQPPAAEGRPPSDHPNLANQEES